MVERTRILVCLGISMRTASLIEAKDFSWHALSRGMASINTL